MKRGGLNLAKFRLTFLLNLSGFYSACSKFALLTRLYSRSCNFKR
ncbi:hypothetical protein CSUNSWCD_531 [Campylobacter showae CSUNSWCD]|uniref:Uncharacterized protein n=1 Tax=Campylobacter showae CSUNSWCD TaxID=1244083 RepID=M5IIU7_9BACT|nr:hypothetical protein CSUNSWCD_531 [Campylobacter showae CSUNSWCD]